MTILCRQAGYLSTMFTQYLDCGFADYLNQVRIERAWNQEKNKR